MAYGQLRFWAAGEPACESEAWPQALFLFCSTDLFSKIGRNSMFCPKIGRISTDIDEHRLKIHQFCEISGISDIHRNSRGSKQNQKRKTLKTRNPDVGVSEDHKKNRIHKSMFCIIWHLGGSR